MPWRFQQGGFKMSVWALTECMKHFGIDQPNKLDNIQPPKKTAKQIKQEAKTIKGAN